MKKFICSILCFSIIFAGMLSASATEPMADMDLMYNSQDDFSDITGNEDTSNWLYQYNYGGEGYSAYKTGEYNADKSRYIFKDESGSEITNLYVRNRVISIKGTEGHKTAYVWIAPYSGKVNLKSAEYAADKPTVIKYNESAASQEYILKANIAHADKDGNEIEDSYWSADIGGEYVPKTYDIQNVEVEKGDRIYFELSGTSGSYNEAFWVAAVTYTEAAAYSADNPTAITNGGEVTCKLLIGPEMTEKSKVHLLVFDEAGSLRTVGNPVEIDTSDINIQKELTVTMPTIGAGETYEGWNIVPFAASADTGRFYQVMNTNGFSIS